jgi:hypothetical protein
MPATLQTARKDYKCQHCGGTITKGQRYYKRIVGGRVYNRMTYCNIEWHADKKECQPHTHKDNCTSDCIAIRK